MHISDGILPPSVCLVGYGLTGLTTWYCLGKINRETDPQEQIPKAALLTAAFFVTSLIHIPLPPSSIHLILNGLMGILLGYYAFLSILIGLFFQAVMFQHGGLTTLGINAMLMGLPALLAYHWYRWGQQWRGHQFPFWDKFLAFSAGAGALALSSVIFTLTIISFISSDFDAKTEQTMTYLALGVYLIQALIEGAFTVTILSFLERVKPELLRK